MNYKGRKQDKTSISRHYQQSGDDGSVSFFGLLRLNAGDKVTLKFETDESSDITFVAHNLNVTLIQVR